MRYRGLTAGLILSLLGWAAHAQSPSSAIPVTVCGALTGGITYSTAGPQPFTQDQNGRLCMTGSLTITSGTVTISSGTVTANQGAAPWLVERQDGAGRELGASYNPSVYSPPAVVALAPVLLPWQNALQIRRCNVLLAGCR